MLFSINLFAIITNLAPAKQFHTLIHPPANLPQQPTDLSLKTPQRKLKVYASPSWDHHIAALSVSNSHAITVPFTEFQHIIPDRRKVGFFALIKIQQDVKRLFVSLSSLQTFFSRGLNFFTRNIGKIMGKDSGEYPSLTKLVFLRIANFHVVPSYNLPSLNVFVILLSAVVVTFTSNRK